jgi:predicted DCC family thiol-disulfide oxidoreductase YuxK
MSPDSPLLLIDGDCAFCMRTAQWVRTRVRPSAPLVPYQSVDLATFSTTAEECSQAVQWVENGRVVASGGRAVCRTLATAPQPWKSLATLMSAPGASWVVDRVYELVAKNRQRLPGATDTCAIG